MMGITGLAFIQLFIISGFGAHALPMAIFTTLTTLSSTALFVGF